MDPLQILPAEIILRILDFSLTSSLTCLTRLNSSWHRFIDETHQDTIYASPSRTSRPHGARDLSFLSQSDSFVGYYDGVCSFKELCRRQTLLARNWNNERPLTRESVFQIGNSPVWRFRADFKRRFFISTSQEGGLSVTDMDCGNLLWSLTKEEIKPFTHLEYQDGVAICDSKSISNGLEVWETDLNSEARGVFRQRAVLTHDCEIRGFQLSYNTLCVVSTEGQGFVYDMEQNPPRLRTHLKIKTNAVGHLDQNASVVMYCLGKEGYHIHDKTSGVLLGTIQPKNCETLYHIHHPEHPPNSIVSTGNSLSSLPSVDVYPPRNPNKERLTPIEVVNGPFVSVADDASIKLEDDEWGAALLTGPLMVGISRGGRVIVCSDWQAALRNSKSLAEKSFLIECEGCASSFDIGGWLSVRDRRLMFEVQDQIYIVALGEDGNMSGPLNMRPSYSFFSSSATQLAAPVSFMALFDDCIMSTYTTVGWRRRTRVQERARERSGIFPTKTIRVLSLAPNLDKQIVETEMESQARSTDETHAMILEIMDLLSEDSGFEDSDSDVDEEPF